MKKSINKVIACDDITVDTITGIIQSAHKENPKNCINQIMKAVMTTNFQPKVFRYMLEKVEKFSEAKASEQLISASIISKMLFLSKRAFPTLAVVNYGNKYNGFFNTELDSVDEYGDIRGFLSNEDQITAVSKLLQLMQEQDLAAFPLLESIKFDSATLRFFEKAFSDFVEAENVAACFSSYRKIIGDDSSMHSDFIGAMAYICMNYEEPSEEEIKSITEIKPSAMLSNKREWTPSSLFKIKDCEIYLTNKEIEEKRVYKDVEDALLSVWHEMVNDAEEVCENVEIKISDPSMNKLVPTKRLRQKSTKMPQNSDETMFSIPEIKRIWDASRNTEAIKRISDGVFPTFREYVSSITSTDDPKYKVIEQFVSNKLVPKVASKTKSTFIGDLKEFDFLGVNDIQICDKLVGPSQTPIVSIKLSDDDGGKEYIGKYISGMTTNKYFNLFIEMKKLFGIPYLEGEIFKTEGKIIMEKSEKGKKSSTKVLDHKIPETKTKTFSVWYCYDVETTKCNKLVKFSEFASNGDNLDMIKEIIKLSIVRWLFSFPATSVDTVYVDADCEIYGLWECIPKTDCKCISSLMNQKNKDIITSNLFVVLEEVMNIFEKSYEKIFSMLKEHDEYRKILISLREKVCPPVEMKEDKRTHYEVARDHLSKELETKHESLKMAAEKKGGRKTDTSQ